MSLRTLEYPVPRRRSPCALRKQPLIDRSGNTGAPHWRRKDAPVDFGSSDGIAHRRITIRRSFLPPLRGLEGPVRLGIDAAIGAQSKSVCPRCARRGTYPPRSSRSRRGQVSGRVPASRSPRPPGSRARAAGAVSRLRQSTHAPWGRSRLRPAGYAPPSGECAAGRRAGFQ